MAPIELERRERRWDSPEDEASIYEKLRPILGDEDANVLMSQFPAVGLLS